MKKECGADVGQIWGRCGADEGTERIIHIDDHDRFLGEQQRCK